MDTADSALAPGEAAFFESGGQTDPEAGAAGGDQGESQAQGGKEGAAPAGAEQGKQAGAEGAQDEQKQKQQEKTVPLAALHQARMEIKETKERFAQLEQKSARMEQIFQQLQQQQRQAQAPQIPALEADPVAHFTARQQQLENYVVQLQEQLQSQGQMSAQQWQDHQQHLQQQQNQQQFAQRVMHHEAEFKKTTPDLDDATKYLKDQIAQDLMARGVVDLNEGVAQQINLLINSALGMGLNPAQLAYQVAQQKGYVPKQQAAPAGGAAPAGKATPSEKIDQINKGQAAARSLSSTGGAGKPELTLEALAEMDDAELAANWGKIQKLM